MKIKKTISIIILLIMILIIFISGCELQIKPKIDTIKEGTLIVGTYPYIPRMTFFNDSKTIMGYDIELAKEIAKRLELSIEFKEIYFPDLFPAIDNKIVDIVISSITITPERSQKYLFSKPYFDGGQVIVAKKDSGIKELNDLKDKKIGTLKSSTSEKKIRSFDFFNPDLVITYGEDDIELGKAIDIGEIDAYIADYVGAVGSVQDYPSLEIVGEPFTNEFYGIMTNKENMDLISEINKIIRDLQREEKLEEFENKWLK